MQVNALLWLSRGSAVLRRMMSLMKAMYHQLWAVPGIAGLTKKEMGERLISRTVDVSLSPYRQYCSPCCNKVRGGCNALRGGRP